MTICRSEYGVVGSDPAAVQYISLCLQYLESRQEVQDSILNLWVQNLNEFTMKSAVEVIRTNITIRELISST